MTPAQGPRAGDGARACVQEWEREALPASVLEELAELLQGQTTLGHAPPPPCSPGSAEGTATRAPSAARVPVGYIWNEGSPPALHPNATIRNVVHRVLDLFAQLGSARRVHKALLAEGVKFPSRASPRGPDNWRAVTYRDIMSVLREPFYAGILGSDTPGAVALHDHHAGYITRARFRRNQEVLERNSHCRPGSGVKSGRGGRALLSGMVRCGRCGAMLTVSYAGGRRGGIRYRCPTRDCTTFTAPRPDRSVSDALLRVVEATCRAPRSEGAETDVVERLRREFGDDGQGWSLRQRAVRVLLSEVTAAEDDASRQVVLTLHWRDGQRTEVRVHKARRGEHHRRTPAAVIDVIRQMRGQATARQIAAALNDQGLTTAHGNPWDAHRVRACARAQVRRGSSR
jgi:hypothetical protein